MNLVNLIKDQFSNQLIGITPLVVVPTHHLDQIAVDDLRHSEVHDGCAGIFDDVGRNEWVRGHTENAAITFALRLFCEHTVHLVHIRRSGRKDDDVCERPDRNRCPDGYTVEGDVKLKTPLSATLFSPVSTNAGGGGRKLVAQFNKADIDNNTPEGDSVPLVLTVNVLQNGVQKQLTSTALVKVEK